MRFPSIKVVASVLRDLNKTEVPPCTCGHEECEGDMPVRLQVLSGGSWEVWNGDPSFDTDARGYWGCAYIPANGKRFNSHETARQLIEDARADYVIDKVNREAVRRNVG